MTDPSDARPADGTPAADRREQILDPAAGAGEHRADSIRDEQATHEAGTVPAAYVGDARTNGDTHPEDAAEEADEWDSAAHRG